MGSSYFKSFESSLQSHLLLLHGKMLLLVKFYKTVSSWKIFTCFLGKSFHHQLAIKPVNNTDKDIISAVRPTPPGWETQTTQGVRHTYAIKQFNALQRNYIVFIIKVKCGKEFLLIWMAFECIFFCIFHTWPGPPSPLPCSILKLGIFV